MARNALGLDFGSAALLSKRAGSVWNCLWGHALKLKRDRSQEYGIDNLYPGPGFISSGTWPSLPKKHFYSLIILISLIAVSGSELLLYSGHLVPLPI